MRGKMAMAHVAILATFAVACKSRSESGVMASDQAGKSESAGVRNDEPAFQAFTSREGHYYLARTLTEQAQQLRKNMVTIKAAFFSQADAKKPEAEALDQVRVDLDQLVNDIVSAPDSDSDMKEAWSGRLERVAYALSELVSGGGTSHLKLPIAAAGSKEHLAQYRAIGAFTTTQSFLTAMLSRSTSSPIPKTTVLVRAFFATKQTESYLLTKADAEVRLRACPKTPAQPLVASKCFAIDAATLPAGLTASKYQKECQFVMRC